MIRMNQILKKEGYGKNNKNFNLVNTPNIRDRLGWLITGLFQSDGSFAISFPLVKNTMQIALSISITLHISSLPLLQVVQNYFGCGTLTIYPGRQEACTFYINNIFHLWHIVLPHFLKYPLIGSKHDSFYIFTKVLTIIYSFNSKKKSKLDKAKILYLGWFINQHSTTRKDSDLLRLLKLLIETDQKILEDTTKNSSLNMIGENIQNIVNNILVPNGFHEFNDILNSSKPYINSTKLGNMNPYLILGMIHGDGSFYVGVRSNGKIRFGFNISTNIDDYLSLYYTKYSLLCGSVLFKTKS